MPKSVDRFSTRIEKIESELQVLLMLQNASSQIVSHVAEKDCGLGNAGTLPDMVDIMERDGSFHSTATSSSQDSKASKSSGKSRTSKNAGMSKTSKVVDTPSKTKPYWQRASDTSELASPKARKDLNVGTSDVMLSLQYSSHSNLTSPNNGKPAKKLANKCGKLSSTGDKENPGERPRCLSDCKGVCGATNTAARLHPHNSHGRDESTVKFERAIAELHQAEDRHRIVEQQNLRLRELLNSNRVTMKENVHSKRVALSVARQLKDKYEAVRADQHRTRDQLEGIKAENVELLKRLTAMTDSNNSLLDEVKHRRKSSASEETNYRMKLELKEEELQVFKSTLAGEIQKLRAGQELEIVRLKKEHEYHLNKLDSEKRTDVKNLKSELKVIVAKKHAELEKSNSLISRDRQELTMKEEDVKRFAGGLAEMSKRANEFEKAATAAEKRAREAEGKLAEAEGKLAEAEAERRVAEKNLAAVVAEKGDLLQDLRGRLSRERDSEMTLNKYKEMIEDNEKARKNIENRCTELEEEVKQLQEKTRNVSDSSSALNDCRQALADKERELRDYLALAAEKDKQIKVEWSNMNNTVQELTEMLRNHKSRIQELTALTKQQESLIATQKETLLDKEEQVRLANQEVEMIRGKSVDLDTQVKNLRQSVRSFEKFREERERRSLSTSTAEEEASRRALENEKDKILIKDKIIDDQAESIKQLKATLNERLERLKVAERELAAAREKAVKLTGDVEVVTREKERLVSEVLTLQDELESRSLCDTSGDSYEHHDELLKQLEDQVETRQQEWKQQLKAVTEEKENALKLARSATAKLEESVDEFKRQIATHKKVQRMLTSLLSEKESQLSASFQKFETIHEKLEAMKAREAAVKRNLESKLRLACDACSDAINDMKLPALNSPVKRLPRKL